MFPSSLYCFWIRFGVTPFNDMSCLVGNLIVFGFTVLAFWSHWLASPPNNPGLMKWEHFRNHEQLSDTKSKANWENPQYRKEMASRKVEYDPETEINQIDCQKCGCIKVEGSHHCSTCGVCVLAMDHHCPWTNNCVGYLTIKPFLLFLFYVSMLCYTMVF